MEILAVELSAFSSFQPNDNEIDVTSLVVRSRNEILSYYCVLVQKKEKEIHFGLKMRWAVNIIDILLS